MADFKLPNLIELNDFGGQWDDYYQYVYECFCEDFITNPLPNFMGKRIGLKRHPITDNKEATFYHITHQGNDETNREPDLRRMERILWVKYMMANIGTHELKVWKNVRKGITNILIYHDDESYLVVVSDRGEYVLPWTAYLIEYENQRRKLISEYDSYIKAEAAKKT